METRDLNNKNKDWPIIGNSHITSFLEKSIANNKVSNAYIFFGPDNLGKVTTAVFFAKSLLCQKKEMEKYNPPCEQCSSCRQIKRKKEDDGNRFEMVHGDFHLIKKEDDKKNITIEQVREFINVLSLSSFLGSYKIGIIKGAEHLSQEASNALLKTLEEPREKVVIILTAGSLDPVPDTIISRSQLLNFYPVKTSDIYDHLIEKENCSRSLAKNISRLSLGRPALATKFFEDEEFYKAYLSKAELFIDFFSQNVNERLMGLQGILGKDSHGQENAKKAINIIGIWRGIVRDLLLLCSNNADLIQHEVYSEKLKAVNEKINKNNLIVLNNILETGQKYVRTNVSPKSVLENIVCNI